MQSSKHTKCDTFVRQQMAWVAFNGRIRCLLCLGCFEGCGTSSPSRTSPKNSPKQVPMLLIWSHLIFCVALQAWVTGSGLFSLLTKPWSLLQQPYLLLIHIISPPILFVLTLHFSAAGIDGWVYLLLFLYRLEDYSASPACNRPVQFASALSAGQALHSATPRSSLRRNTLSCWTRTLWLSCLTKSLLP